MRVAAAATTAARSARRRRRPLPVSVPPPPFSVGAFTVAVAAHLLILSSVANVNVVLVRANCLVGGDMMFVEGQSFGSHLGVECIESDGLEFDGVDSEPDAYDGIETACGPDSKMIEVEKRFRCPMGQPYCVQCGPRGPGAALCLSTPDLGNRDCSGGGAGEGGVAGIGGDPDFLWKDDGDDDDDYEIIIEDDNIDGFGFEEDFLPPSTPGIVFFGAFDQCDNDDDIEIWTSNGGMASVLPEQFDLCSSSAGCPSSNDPDGCVEACIAETYGYTSSCAACFGDLHSCVASNDGCADACAADGPDDGECQECSAPCVEELNECTGLPEVHDDDPPPSESIGQATTTVAATVATTSATTGATVATTSATTGATVAVSDATEWQSSCADGREGVDDPTCTLSLREGTCEDKGLGEEGCLALGCCQWDASAMMCSAACVVPDDGEACCLLADEEMGTGTGTDTTLPPPMSTTTQEPTPGITPQPTNADGELVVTTPTPGPTKDADDGPPPPTTLAPDGATTTLGSDDGEDDEEDELTDSPTEYPTSSPSVSPAAAAVDDVGGGGGVPAPPQQQQPDGSRTVDGNGGPSAMAYVVARSAIAAGVVMAALLAC